jgi:AcrR family transcriptional regulator
VVSVTAGWSRIPLRLRPMARPRSEEARKAALEATLDLVLEHGVDGVTFDEVATRSGVAKTTLYRHFGTKQAMLVAAANSCFVEQPTPDTGDLLEDLRLIFDRGSDADERHRLPDIMPRLLAAGDAELHRCLLAMLEERRRPVRTVLQLAQLRGEISRDLDLDAALAMLIGPFVQRKMLDGLEVSPEFRDAVFQTVVAGLRAGAAVPAGVA